MYALWVFGLSRNTGDKGTLGGRWGAKLHIIKHYQNWTLGTFCNHFCNSVIFGWEYMEVISVIFVWWQTFVILVFWCSVPFVLVRGVFLSTKIARNTPNSMKENRLYILLHHATKRSGGDAAWSRDRNNDYRYFLIGPEIINSIISWLVWALRARSLGTSIKGKIKWRLTAAKEISVV